MQERLTHLHSLATQLARDARPERALLLECLIRLSLQELRQVERERKIDDACVAQVAKDLGEPFDVVRHVVAEFYRLDLNLFGDHQVDYESALTVYRNGGPLQREVAQFWKEECPAPAIAFLLFGGVKCWNPGTGELYGIDAQKDSGSEVEDNRFCQASDGYFVAHDLAFRSEVEFLAATFYEEWPNWDELWDRWYGWERHWKN